MNNITYGGELDLTDTKRIDIPDNELDKCTVRRGDVLFNGGGEIGKSIICNDSKPIYVQGGAVLYARTSASNKLEASYLKTYYETSHSRKYIDAASAGGTMKHFTLKPAQEMPVYLPEAEEQKQIGDFYICIDNLITLHQRKFYIYGMSNFI